MRFLGTVMYQGTDFGGFQSQINTRTVQDEIEKCLKIYFKENIRIFYASRTDAKVHALAQKISFDLNTDFDISNFIKAINVLLPKDIYFKDLVRVSDQFQVRKNIKYKHYRYLISLKSKDVFHHNQVYNCTYDLDLELMRDTLALFKGQHDFSSFNTTSYSIIPDQIREIIDVEMRVSDDLIILDFYGKSFLRHMIRIMVGTLLDISRGKKPQTYLVEMLKYPSKTKYHRFNIDGQGLYLYDIVYEDLEKYLIM